MHKINISNDTAEALFRDILVQDYKGLTSDINKLEANADHLLPYEQEDLTNNKRFHSALAVMMEYYLSEEERQEFLRETADSK